MVLGALAVYLFMAAFGFFLGRFHSEQAYLKKLDEKNKLIEKDIGAILGEASRIEFVKKLIDSRRVPLQTIYELQLITPQEISITFIGMEESGRITLRGEGAQLSDVFKYVTTLENSKYFNTVTTRYTRTKNVRGRELTEFEASFNFKAEA